MVIIEFEYRGKLLLTAKLHFSSSKLPMPDVEMIMAQVKLFLQRKKFLAWTSMEVIQPKIMAKTNFLFSER